MQLYAHTTHTLCVSYISSGALDSYNTFTVDDESVVHRSADYTIAEASHPLRLDIEFELNLNVVDTCAYNSSFLKFFIMARLLGTCFVWDTVISAYLLSNTMCLLL